MQQFQDSNRPFTVVLSTLRRPLRFFFLLCLLMQVNGIIYKVLPSNDSQFEGSIFYSLLVFIFDQHRTLVPKIVVKFPSKNNRSSASTSLIRQTAVPPLPLPTQLRGALFDRQNRNAVCSLLTIMSRNVFRNYLIG